METDLFELTRRINQATFELAVASSAIAEAQALNATMLDRIRTRIAEQDAQRVRVRDSLQFHEVSFVAKPPHPSQTVQRVSELPPE